MAVIAIDGSFDRDAELEVANEDTQSVVTALIKQSRTLPGEFYPSLTGGRGKALADHKRLALAIHLT